MIVTRTVTTRSRPPQQRPPPTLESAASCAPQTGGTLTLSAALTSSASARPEW